MAHYYVDNVLGADNNAGTSEGDKNAWGTISHAFSSMTAGDTVFILQNTQPYLENPVVSGIGSTYSWITAIGYASTTGDSGQVTIEASGGTYGISYSTTGNYYWRFENIIVQNASNTGIYGPAVNWNMFLNCESNNNGYMGMDLNLYNIVAECGFDGNTDTGGEISTGYFVGCKAYNNGNHGLRLVNGPTAAIYNVCFSNAAANLNGGGGLYAHNTMDGDVGDSNHGVNQGTSMGMVLVNNIAYDCGNGFTRTTGMRAEYGRNNLMYSNTADYAGWGSGLSETDSDITGVDPGFASETTNDYSLTPSSAGRLSGWDHAYAWGEGAGGGIGVDIGAYQMRNPIVLIG